MPQTLLIISSISGVNKLSLLFEQEDFFQSNRIKSTNFHALDSLLTIHLLQLIKSL